MSTPGPIALNVLRIQADHLVKQIDGLREAILQHDPCTTRGGHMRAAADYLIAAELLARYVRSCIECEEHDRAKLAAHLTEQDRKLAEEASNRG